jgi:hypothetical protein
MLSPCPAHSLPSPGLSKIRLRQLDCMLTARNLRHSEYEVAGAYLGSVVAGACCACYRVLKQSLTYKLHSMGAKAPCSGPPMHHTWHIASAKRIKPSAGDASLQSPRQPCSIHCSNCCCTIMSSCFVCCASAACSAAVAASRSYVLNTCSVRQCTLHCVTVFQVFEPASIVAWLFIWHPVIGCELLPELWIT